MWWQLEAWSEYIAYRHEKVSSTGKIIPNRSKPKITDKTDNWGFRCTKCLLDWSCTKWGYSSGNFPPEIDELFTKIVKINSKDDVEN